MRDRPAGWWPFGDDHEEERLSAFLDDELSEGESLEVTHHVAGCPSCLEELEAIREARGALRNLPDVQPPEDLYRNVLAQPTSTGRRRSTVARVVAAAAASALLLGIAAFAAGTDDPGTVSPPVDVFVVDHVARMEGGPVLTPVDLGR